MFDKIKQVELKAVVKDRENYYKLFKDIGINHVIKAEDSFIDYK